MSNDAPQKGNHVALWATVGKVAAPFFIGLASAAFWFGTRSANLASNQKEIMLWKTEVTTTLARMDKTGTNVGERFGLEQAKELGRIEKDIEELKKEAKSIEAMKLKIDALERTTYSQRPPKP